MAATLKSRRLARERDAGGRILPALPDDPEAAAEARKEMELVKVGNLLLPSWWGNLPDTAKFEDEVEWVHQNRSRVISETPSGCIKLDWRKAKGKPPSDGAVALMQDASVDARGFRELVRQVKKGEADSNPEMLAKERKKIAEIRKVLEKFKDG